MPDRLTDERLEPQIARIRLPESQGSGEGEGA